LARFSTYKENKVFDMGQPFSIQFDFPIAHSDSTILLKAIAQLHHSEPYYVIKDFQFATGQKKNQSTSILPPQEIKVLKKGKINTWVHRESSKESLLSRAIGKAIEEGDSKN
jgi:hypothetical protein